MIYVGVDPAFRSGGFRIAIVDMKKKTVHFSCMKDVFEWYEYVRDRLSGLEECYICIENSNAQDATFDMSGTRSQIAKRSRNVGCNQAASEYAVIAAKKFMPEGRVFEVSPLEKGEKIRSNTTFQALVGFYKLEICKKGPVIQDERDAFKLAMLLPSLLISKNEFKRERSGIKP